jgi:hypothetical protein
MLQFECGGDGRDKAGRIFEDIRAGLMSATLAENWCTATAVS